MSENKNKTDNIKKIKNDNLNEDLRKSIVHENPKPTTPPPRSREPAKPSNPEKK